MRNLLACTCLTPVFILAAATSHAETTISTKTTGRLSTSTVKSGGPDSITIAAAGSVVPTGPGAAVTIDSNHGVKNDGAITITDANDATGILANPGTSATITNTGKIEILETYVPADPDKDGDNDGAFATGARRFGIRLAPGGTFTGSIVNSGTIAVEGNDSAGIAADSRLAGSLTSSGAIAVTGDRSAGIRAGEVTGDVRITGAVTATGKDSVGIALDGPIGGALVVQSAITASGYRFTAAPGDTTKLDADDLLQGGPALRIAGDVAKGILFDAPPPNASPTDNDEDKDGIEDSKEGTAAITSYGAAPAVQIGAADHAVAIGAVTGQAAGHGIVINGNVAGRGVYAGVNATGLKIGGLGGSVTVAGGLTLNGQLLAQANGAAATGLQIGNGATVNEIRVAGTLQADGVNGRALQIDQGATVTTVRNSGRIAAGASGAGTAAAIVDGSGKLVLIENSGAIAAGGVALETGRAIAIDLRNNVSGATVRQTLVAQGVAAPSISGNILFGVGDDLLDLADGEVKGNTLFGAGADRLKLAGDASYEGRAEFGAGADQMSLAGSSVFSGTADFGGGADLLTLSGTSRFSGTLANASGLSVQVDGGTLESTSTAPVAIGSLSVGAQGVLGVTIDPQAGKSGLYQVAGTAAFAQGAKLQVKLANVGGSLGKFTVVKAGSLSGASGLTATSVLLPVFLKTGLTVDQAAGEIAVTIGRKSASEIGLNGSEGRAWDALFGVLDKDAKVAGAFLEMREADTFREALQQLLPEHAGGIFETVTQGSRATARFLRDPGSPFADMGGWGFWLQQVAWGTSKDLGDTSSYDVTGWGAAGGAEVKLGGAGNAGLSLAYLAGRDEQGGNENSVKADQYELGAYWRARWGGLRAHARASAARIGFEGSRTFTGKIGTETVSRTALGDWDGNLVSAAAGLSYELGSGRLTLRPAASLDYYRLSEDGYSETGGGNAMNLVVDGRRSDELAAEASLSLGYSFGKLDGDGGWLRAEIEGGRRQILAGAIGETVARFGTGTAFTLLPEARSDGWLGRLRLLGGNSEFSLGGEVGVEEQQSRAGVSARVSLQAAF
jgi:uncharacterized protein with beta-barrel porin domain